jgi:hypothetical protein
VQVRERLVQVRERLVQVRERLVRVRELAPRLVQRRVPEPGWEWQRVQVPGRGGPGRQCMQRRESATGWNEISLGKAASKRRLIGDESFRIKQPFVPCRKTHDRVRPFIPSVLIVLSRPIR